jgi:hypothetical protein
MKLRVIAGEALVQQSQAESGLQDIFRSPQLLIQGDAAVEVLHHEGQARAVLAGGVLGWRGTSGEMHRMASMRATLGSLIDQQSLDSCLESFEGSYVLIQLDPLDPQGGCEIACDRYAQRDLYYQERDGGVIFATDLGLLPVSQKPTGYDQVALAHAFSVYGYRPAKHQTWYQGVQRLGVRQVAGWHDGQLSLRELPLPLVQTGHYGRRELQEYADLLLDAVALRSSRHGNVVYLSSGWDSTSILACLVKLHGASKVRAVIGRMQYAERTGVINQFEIERAQAVANYFGVQLDIAEFDYRQQGPDLVERLQPLLRSQMLSNIPVLNQVILAEHAAKTTNGEAVFAGEISDGVHNLGFSQFVTIFHPVLEFREYSDKMASYLFGPTFLRLLHTDQFQADPVYNLLRSRLGTALFDEPAADAAGRTRQLLASFFLRANRMPLWSLGNTNLLTEQGSARYSSEMEEQYLAGPAAEVTPETLYSCYLHLYNSFHWQGSTVASFALSAEEYGLHMNLPFWDSRLQEFLAAMPESWGRGLDLKPTKYPLKWMLEHCIDYPLHLQVGPHSYLYDVDPNFSHSAEIMYGSAFKPALKQALEKRTYQQVLSPEMFNLEYLDQAVTRYLQDTEIRGAELSDLMALGFFSLSGWYGKD